jgi:hypothetical protein
MCFIIFRGEIQIRLCHQELVMMLATKAILLAIMTVVMSIARYLKSLDLNPNVIIQEKLSGLTDLIKRIDQLLLLAIYLFITPGTQEISSLLIVRFNSKDAKS